MSLVSKCVEDIDIDNNYLSNFNTIALDLAASKTQLPLVSAKNSNCDLNNQRNYSDDSGHESKQISTLLTASVVGAQGLTHNNTFTKQFPNNLCRRSYHDITFSSIVQDNEQPSSSVVSSGHNSHNISNHIEQQTSLDPIHSNYVSTTYLPVSNKVSFDNRQKESKDSQVKIDSNSMTQFNDNLTLGTLHIKEEVNHNHQDNNQNNNQNNIQDANTKSLTEDLFVLEDEYIDNDFEEYFDGILEESKMEPQNEVNVNNNDNNDSGNVLTKD